jgi:predicted acylesterase/phospholipase RssA
MSVLYKKLALGGGGVKGILHIGALQELSKHQPLYFPNGVYGSSIGSIVATYVAFELPIEKVIPLAKKYLSYEKIIPKPDMSSISNCFSAKGIFSMNLFEKTLKEMFLEAGLDIEDKKLNDAKMPLHIVTTNITKRIPSVISGDVPLITALKCSCCLPAVFHPQELYDQLYIDGDILSPCISNVVDIDSETLVISLLKQNADSVCTKNIENMSPLEYIGNLYLMVMIQLYKAQTKSGILHLKHPTLFSTSKLEDVNVDEICDYAANELRTFLSQRHN